MILEITLLTGILILLVAFGAEFIDSTLGMGYGTTLTPILLLIGFEPLQIVPAVLLSELLTGLFAAFMHHKLGNVNFDFRNDTESKLKKRSSKLRYIPKSKASKVALLLGLMSVVGTIAAVLIAVNISKFYLNLYIGMLVLVMGIIILFKHRKIGRFSWKKIIGLGVIASFNKGMSGGGYGPVVTAGQILSGLKSKAAIAITSFAEGITCLVGVITYLLVKSSTQWNLAPFLIIGAMLSVPLSAHVIKIIKTNKLTLIISIVTICLGLLTLGKLFL